MEAPVAPARRRSLWRRVRHRLRPLVNRPAAALAAALAPPLYVAYMRFVWATSTVEVRDFGRLQRLADEHDGAIALLWHEEVFSVPFGYPWVGVQGHALVSVADAGEVLARILVRCGYVVSRGGSTTSRSRRREGVIDELVEYMQTHPRVLYGLAVDGGKGPPYRMKTGGVVVAATCQKPLALVRTWYRRMIRMRSWDRTALPLPWNHIIYYYRGPYFPPKDPNDREALEALHRRLEDDLIDLAAESYAELGQPRPAALVKRSREA
jgi:hypothetical protein